MFSYSFKVINMIVNNFYFLVSNIICIFTFINYKINNYGY